MIRAIRCDQPSFRQVTFQKGFNIVLAERTRESSDKDSRNGLGKTTLIEIIHFCLGSNLDSDSVLKSDEMKNWTFVLELTLRGKIYSIFRNTANPAKIKIDGDFSDWVIKPEYSEDEKAHILKVSDWRRALGYLIFDLSKETKDRKYGPTFRSLISYFIRKGVGAFGSPFMHYPRQMEWDKQVNNAFLLGLNWEYAMEFQDLKDNEKILRDLKSAASKGLLTGYMGSLGELEGERVRREEDIKKLDEELNNFKVHPQYHDIQEEANKITKEIHDLVNKSTLEQQILNKYKESVSQEIDIPISQVELAYKEAGLAFPLNLSRRLEEVKNFHSTLIENRKVYLNSEIMKISGEIDQINHQVEMLSSKRAELLIVLETHGALGEYTKLQQRATSLKQQLEEIKNRIENLKKFDKESSILKIMRQELLQKARRDLEERKTRVEKAIKLFNSNSNILYSEPGLLSIDITDSGYQFSVDIKRAKSQGIGYMKVFCYDLMLIQLLSEQQDMPGFLIHDSTIFDGVDERQIAKALELAAQESENRGFQYICAINSDALPVKDFSPVFRDKLKQFVRIKFTDAKENGGLLGIRF